MKKLIISLVLMALSSCGSQGVNPGHHTYTIAASGSGNSFFGAAHLNCSVCHETNVNIPGDADPGSSIADGTGKLTVSSDTPAVFQTFQSDDLSAEFTKTSGDTALTVTIYRDGSQVAQKALASPGDVATFTGL
jgi:hypothetical protein